MFRRTLSIFILSLLGFALLGPAAIPARAQAGEQGVIVLTADGVVAPAMQLYLERGLQLAASRPAGLVVLQLNTPGGSIDTMTQILELLQASPVPVVVYVTPQGGMAASAGTLITLAGSLAAMAPQTTIGAASPVGSQGENIDSTEATKVKEVFKATVRGFTKNRPAEATAAAESAIENATALTADEALKIGLIDFQAASLTDLLTQLDGRTVTVQNRSLTLHTRGAPVEDVPPSLLEEGLTLFTDPNLVFIFISLGTLAILAEISNPGGWVAGTAGVIFWLLGFYGLGVLPVNWFGLLFMALAFLLFILDIKAPTHGALTAVGAASFIAGALILFNSVQVPGIPTISVPLVVGTGIAIAGMFFAIVTVALRAQSLPVVTGTSTLVGKIGTVRSDLSPQGEVQVGGEAWTARPAPGEPFLPQGTRVEVVSIEGIRIRVKKVD